MIGHTIDLIDELDRIADGAADIYAPEHVEALAAWMETQFSADVHVDDVELRGLPFGVFRTLCRDAARGQEVSDAGS